MPYYVRYFNTEQILPAKEHICGFLAEKKVLKQHELQTVGQQIEGMKEKKTRIFLDDKKKKYLLIIPTESEDISQFQMGRQNQIPSRSLATEKKQSIKNHVIRDLNTHYLGWHIFSLTYERRNEEEFEPCVFKAKLNGGSVKMAYEKMKAYLIGKYGDQCRIPELSLDVIDMEEVKD